MIVGIIGGTGLAALGGDSSPAVESADTPFGSASDTPRRFANLPNAIFLNRHGEGHTVLPHEINYRANVWLLKDLGASAVVAVFAVGGISRSLADGDFVVPGQLVDYTWGRAHTFAGLDSRLRGASPSRSPAEGSHVDFSDPFDARLREMLGRSAGRVGIDVSDGVYGCTQGPRFETVAEIDRMERDGWIVRLPHPDDRRKKMIQPTSAAKGIWKQILQTWHEVIAAATDGLSERQLATVLTGLGRLRLNLTEGDVARLREG